MNVLKTLKNSFIFVLACIILIQQIELYADCDNNYIGDLNGDTQISAIDLVIMMRYLLGIYPNLSLDVGDVTLDGLINTIDLVRMKKYLSGEDQKTYTNRVSEVVTWYVLKGDSGFGVLTPVSYRVNVISSIFADTITYRHIYKINTFAYTYKGYNSIFEDPSIEIGTTEINEATQNMVHSGENILVDPDWIWDDKTATVNSNYPLHSNFSCVVSCMQDQALYALNTVTNSFEF